MSAFLSISQAQARLERGDAVHMELRHGSRQWWFEAPLAYASDAVIGALLFGHAPAARMFELGDSLFGLPMNSQTWSTCTGGVH